MDSYFWQVISSIITILLLLSYHMLIRSPQLVTSKFATAFPSTARKETLLSLGRLMARNDDTTKKLAQAKSEDLRRPRFPLSVRSSFQQWWTALTPETTEQRVLSVVQHVTQLDVPDSTTKKESNIPQSNSDDQTLATGSGVSRKWNLKLVKLSGENRFINEYSIEREHEKVHNTLVMLHGYGTGLALWYKNYEALSKLQGWRLFSLDLLGMGRSSRPRFRVHCKDAEGKIDEAESWFIDALEEWRIEKKIDTFTLMGHSLGGYMSVAYALKYPGHLNKLILVSPAGMLGDPNLPIELLEEPKEKSNVMEEFTACQSTTKSDSDGTPNFLTQPVKGLTASTTEKLQEWHYPKFLAPLWDASISPFIVFRWTGPFGPKLASAWSSRRFSHLPANEADALHDYSYSLFMQPSSGEHALSYVLAPGIYARRPLIRRIQDIGRRYTPSPSNLTTGCPDLKSNHGAPQSEVMKGCSVPIVFFYGENDWMDKDGGYIAQEKIRKLNTQESTTYGVGGESRDNADVKIIIVPGAGHILYLDGWEYFNDKVVEEMEDVTRRQAKTT